MPVHESGRTLVRPPLRSLRLDRARPLMTVAVLVAELVVVLFVGVLAVLLRVLVDLGALLRPARAVLPAGEGVASGAQDDRDREHEDQEPVAHVRPPRNKSS